MLQQTIQQLVDRILRFNHLWAAGLLCTCSMAAVAAPMKPLVLAFSPLPPWKTVDASGRAAGPYLDIVTALAGHLGVPLQVRLCPLLRCLQWLRAGDADLAIGIAPGVGRDGVVEFLQPPFAPGSAIGFYRRKDNTALRVRQYNDLSPLRIGLAGGAHYFTRFDQDASLLKDVAPDKLSNLRKLLAGRIDVAIMVCGEANVLLQNAEFHDKIVLAGPVVVTGPRNLVLSRASSYFVEKTHIEHVLQQMVQSGEIHRLLAPVED